MCFTYLIFNYDTFNFSNVFPFFSPFHFPPPSLSHTLSFDLFFNIIIITFYYLSEGLAVAVTVAHSLFTFRKIAQMVVSSFTMGRVKKVDEGGSVIAYARVQKPKKKLIFILMLSDPPHLSLSLSLSPSLFFLSCVCLHLRERDFANNETLGDGGGAGGGSVNLRVFIYLF